MRLKLSGFVQKDQFDLNSYLNYLFNKLNEHSSTEENKSQEETKRRN